MSEKLTIEIWGKDKFSGAFNKLKSHLPSMKTMAIATTAAVGGLSTALYAMTTKTAGAYDQVQKLSDQLGVSTEFLSKMQVAADFAGIKTQTLNKAVQMTQVRIGEAARGIGEGKEAFDMLGITLRDTTGKLKTAEQIMPELAGAFHNLTDATQKSELASKIFGQRGMSMLQMFKDGEEGLRKMTDEAEKFGLVVSAKAGANAAEFNDSLTRMKGSFTGIRNAIAEKLMPILTNLQNKFADFITRNRKGIADFAENAIVGVMRVYIGFDELGNRISRFFSMLTNKEGFQVLIDNAVIMLQQIGNLFLIAVPAWGETLISVISGAFEGVVETGKWAWLKIKGFFTGEEGPSLGDLIFNSLNAVVEERKAEIDEIWRGVAESAQPHFETMKESLANVFGDEFFETINERTEALREHLSLWRDQDLEDQEAYQFDSLTSLDKYYKAKEKRDKKDKDEAEKSQKKYDDARIKTACETLGNLSSIGNAFGRRGFEIAKSASLGEAIMSTYAGMDRALREYPWPYSFAIAGVIGAKGFAEVANIQSQTYAAHGGLTNVPKEQTYLLDKGERVLSPNQNRDFTEFIRGGGAVHVDNLTVENHILENATNVDALMSMDRRDWEDICQEKIIPAFATLARQGITA